MTATSYVTLDNDDLGANKIFRAATASALNTNPVSIAERGTGAPWLNGVGAIEAITSSSGNWTVPTGVYRIRVECTGAGGGGGSSTGGGNGGNTTFGTLTGNGGGGGAAGGFGNATGGTATGGTINFSGGNSVLGTPGSSKNGRAANASGAAQYGGGGYPNGAAGGTAVKVISVEPGDLIAYSIGTGGTAGTGTTTAGADGIIIIEY